jgi:hypothetical protein
MACKVIGVPFFILMDLPRPDLARSRCRMVTPIEFNNDGRTLGPCIHQHASSRSSYWDAVLIIYICAAYCLFFFELGKSLQPHSKPFLYDKILLSHKCVRLHIRNLGYFWVQLISPVKIWYGFR